MEVKLLMERSIHTVCEFMLGLHYRECNLCAKGLWFSGKFHQTSEFTEHYRWIKKFYRKLMIYNLSSLLFAVVLSIVISISITIQTLSFHRISISSTIVDTLLKWQKRLLFSSCPFTFRRVMVTLSETKWRKFYLHVPYRVLLWSGATF